MNAADMLLRGCSHVVVTSFESRLHVGKLPFIRRLNVSVRCLVSNLENAVIAVLQEYGIQAQSDRDRPGVYISTGAQSGAKICSVGLRIRRGKSYHGLAFNIHPDLSPFMRINPCGYEGQAVTSMQSLGLEASLSEIGERLTYALADGLGYNGRVFVKQSTI